MPAKKRYHAFDSKDVELDHPCPFCGQPMTKLEPVYHKGPDTHWNCFYCCYRLKEGCV